MYCNILEEREIMSLERKTFAELTAQKNAMAMFEQVSILLTRECPISCEHCYSNCGQTAPKGDDKKIMSRIKNICDNDEIKTILITGGEPFLKYDFLIEVVKVITSYNKEVILYTNAYWASTIDIVKEKLNKLKDVTLIMTSVDRYHQKFIPLKNVKNLVKGAQEIGFYNGIVLTLEPDDEEFEIEVREKFSDISNEYFEIITQPISLIGRAENLYDKYSSYFENNIPKGICSLMTSVIDESGNFFGCCCIHEKLPIENPFYYGNIDEDNFSNIFKRFKEDIVSLGLRTLGPKRLFELVEEKHKNQFEKFKKSKYLKDDMCRFCLDLFTIPGVYNSVKEELNSKYGKEKLNTISEIIYNSEMKINAS